MTNLKKLTVAMAVVVTVCAYLPQDAQADGPLRRWWRNVTGRNNTACCATTAPTTAFSPAVAPNVANLQPGQCMRTCQKTCSRTVVNYVPQTAYRTAYKRVPVTQYRPVTNSDPCTGCTVTCMKPCTTYTYQCQRVPYTTYKPVYRTQTYKVPVTTITNDCATGTCGTCPTGTCGTVANFAPQTGCSTCGTGNTVSAQNFSPLSSGSSTQTYTIDPSSSIGTQSSFGTSGGFAPTPADQQPLLNIPSPQPGGSGSRNDYNAAPLGRQAALSGIANPQMSQRPVTPQFDPTNRKSFNASAPAPVPAFEQLRQPAVINFDGHTAKNPVRRSWDYNPVRFASTQLPTERRMTVFAGKVGVVEAAPKQKQVRKSRWVEIE